MEQEYIPTELEATLAGRLAAAKESFDFIGGEVSLFKTSVKDQILQGYLNALEFYRKAKIITEALEDLKKDPDIFDCAWTEREKYGKEKPVINGATFDSSQRTTYDYASCGDPTWFKLKNELSEREKFLKTIKSPLTTVDPETGETVTINPATIKVSNFITVKC